MAFNFSLKVRYLCIYDPNQYFGLSIILYYYQRMNKFKFEPPQQHRRSLQQPKNQHVALMATLDKCTQILRQDRLFLRNQIKNCSQEVLDIFKLFPRQSQLQHLQTRLRKYVQQTKSRLKNEQLTRFKETLTSQIVFPQPKRTNNPPKPSQSTLKHPLKPATSTQLGRSGRMNRSQQHAPNHLNMNSSLRHFQEILRQKLSQEVIEERESENVTSARQGCQQSEVNRQSEYQRSKPLQEQFFDSVQNKFAGRSAALQNNFIPTKNIGDSLTFLNDFSKEKNKSTQELPTMKAGPWQFQKKAKQVLYQYQYQPAQEDPLQLNLNFCQRSRQKQSLPSEQRDDSIFDRHFYGTSEKSATPLSQQRNEYSSHISQEIKNPMSLSIKEGTYSNLSNSNLYEQKETVTSKWAEPSIVNFKLKESSFKETEETAINRTSISRIEDARKSEENLFTPQQLLNQCRNFLKYRGDSNHKSNAQSNVHSNLAQSITHPTEQTVLELTKPKMENPTKELISTKKQEDSGYVFPEIKDSSKKSEGPKEDNFNYTHFETFANSQDTKSAFNSLHLPASPPSLPIIPAQHTFHGLIEEKIPHNFSIQDFLETLMEAAQMNPFIAVRALSGILNGHENGQALKQIFKRQLSLQKDEELCLPDLAQAINERYNQEQDNKYPHDDRAINGVYDLLDIDQKGYVSREDLSAFLSQIEEAEVDNLEEVSQQLWRLFEGADFSNKHKLSYWHFYLVKSSEEFERVSQLLGEFQFQIERNE